MRPEISGCGLAPTELGSRDSRFLRFGRSYDPYLDSCPARRAVHRRHDRAGGPTGRAPRAGDGCRRGTGEFPTPGVGGGPRLTPEWPRFEPMVAPSRGAPRALFASGSDNHTFVFSTLALVLIGVVVVLLVTR